MKRVQIVVLPLSLVSLESLMMMKILGDGEIFTISFFFNRRFVINQLSIFYIVKDAFLVSKRCLFI